MGHYNPDAPNAIISLNRCRLTSIFIADCWPALRDGSLAPFSMSEPAGKVS